METARIKEAARAGIPIFVGYLPAAAAFGILSKSCQLTLLECLMFSAVVFAGASQFIALNLLVTGMGFGGIILTTLLVNFRHFLMSAYLSTRLENEPKKYLFPIAFGVTDEVFSVLSVHRGPLTKTLIFILELSAYSAWVSGTLAGFILGGFLPERLNQSMGIALYALLAAILTPLAKDSARILVIAGASGLLNTILVRLGVLPEGWTIIVCIVLVAFTASLSESGTEKETE